MLAVSSLLNVLDSATRRTVCNACKLVHVESAVFTYLHTYSTLLAPFASKTCHYCSGCLLRGTLLVEGRRTCSSYDCRWKRLLLHSNVFAALLLQTRHTQAELTLFMSPLQHVAPIEHQNQLRLQASGPPLAPVCGPTPRALVVASCNGGSSSASCLPACTLRSCPAPATTRDTREDPGQDRDTQGTTFTLKKNT